MPSGPDPSAILLAKAPVPGRVKTRLVGSRFDHHAAAAIAESLLRCAVDRLMVAFEGRVQIALSPDEASLNFHHPIPLIPQGDGDLGARLDRLWKSVDGPVAFFGMDSPDVPMTTLRALRGHLLGATSNEIFIGPTRDGGYWTLASSSYHPEVLDSIDWGGPEVYDQSVARARGAGLRVRPLRPWFDVDDAADVDALIARLEHVSDDPALVTLHHHLNRLNR